MKTEMVQFEDKDESFQTHHSDSFLTVKSFRFRLEKGSSLFVDDDADGKKELPRVDYVNYFF